MTNEDIDFQDFSPATEGWTPLFIDTTAFHSLFDEREERHELTRRFFKELSGPNPIFPYRPLFTNTYVIDELIAGLQSHRSQEVAEQAVRKIMEWADEGWLIICDEGEAFEKARERFFDYGEEISLTDHIIAVHSHQEKVEHLIAYDGDFKSFDLNLIPYSQ